MLNMYKIMFMFTLMISTLISISALSWMGIWIGLEINLLSMIPLMSNKFNSLNTEASIKYFITQALASTLVMISFLMMMKSQSNEIITLMVNSSMLMKMGAAPFHFWFPEILEGLTWMTSLMILTWQKIAPMIILSYSISNNFLILTILFSMSISGILGINQISLRKILAYSSINHMGWMIGAMMFFESIWSMYFLVYCLISITMIMFFSMLNVFYLNQLFMVMSNNFILKTMLMINFLSLGGLPPFLGFFPKWLTIQFMIMNKAYFLIMIMIILTMIPLYFYTRTLISTLVISSNELNFLNQTKFNNYLMMSFNLMILFSLVLITLLFNFL